MGTIVFDSTIAYDQLWFIRSNDDLVVSVIGEGQAVTVAGWYASSDNHVGQIAANNGYTLGSTGIGKLVEAMAAFAPPAAGETTLPWRCESTDSIAGTPTADGRQLVWGAGSPPTRSAVWSPKSR